MNKQTISFSKNRISRILALALPIGVLCLSQGCAPPPNRRVEVPKSIPVATSEIATPAANHSFNK
jgi:hypothetical protein